MEDNICSAITLTIFFNQPKNSVQAILEVITIMMSYSTFLQDIFQDGYYSNFFF